MQTANGMFLENINDVYMLHPQDDEKKRNECERRRKKNTCSEYWYALDCVSNNLSRRTQAARHRI